MRYTIFIIVTALLVVLSLDADIQKITPWLLGINFTIAVFSINFTFFGHQLSKYQAIYNKISKRQWFNILALMLLPFLPLVCFLINPDYLGKVALWVLPILVLSSVDNAKLTAKYLSPNEYIKSNINDKSISRYLTLLSKEVKKEVDVHEVYMENRDKFQIPLHGYSFEPTILGLEPNDIWDSITVITNLSVENNDYPVFKQSLSAVLKLVTAFYSFKYEDKKSYRVDIGIKFIAHKRLRSIITKIVDDDKNGFFYKPYLVSFVVF